MKKIFKIDLVKKISQISLIVLLVLLINGVSIKQMAKDNKQFPEEKYTSDTIVKLSEENNLETKNTLDLFLETNEEQIRFFSRMFNLNYEDVVSKIRETNPNPDAINIYNIGQIKDDLGNIYTYNSVDRGILEYFLFLDKNNPEMQKVEYQPYNGDAEYIEALIEYFSSLYPNVDHKLLLSIGAAESGYFQSKKMLAKNNIYGGMGSKGLITYPNIEYGVMSYVKTMADNYYDKGLNTIESIGNVFCPKNINGVKIVNPHWINLVNNALKNYNYDLRYVTVAQLNDLILNEI